MKKIAYIEIDTHGEIASNFMSLMMDSNEFEVQYFFSKRIKDQLQVSGKNIHLCDSSTLLPLLKDFSFDLVIIGTAHRYFNVWLKVTELYQTSIITHNLNFAKATFFQLFRTTFLDDQLFRLKLWWKEALFLTPKVYKTAKKWLVLDKNLLQNDKTEFLPLFYVEFVRKNIGELLSVVIPGNVSQKRRDYDHIFTTIRKEIPNFAGKFQFVFLGKAQGKELKELKKLKAEVSEYCEIIYFHEKLATEDFSSYLKHANVLWCPIVKETSFMSRPEIYGETKATGNIGDAIKFGKLAVFPEDYKTELPFIIAEKENVFQQFIELQDLHFDFEKKYNKRNVNSQLEDTLEKLIG